MAKSHFFMHRVCCLGWLPAALMARRLWAGPPGIASLAARRAPRARMGGCVRAWGAGCQSSEAGVGCDSGWVAEGHGLGERNLLYNRQGKRVNYNCTFQVSPLFIFFNLFYRSHFHSKAFECIKHSPFWYRQIKIRYNIFK